MKEGRPERTFALIKPDAVRAKHVGQIISMIENSPTLKIVDISSFTLDREDVEHLYTAHMNKPFFESLAQFTMSGHVVMLVLEGVNAVVEWRRMMGATDSNKADPETIRGMFGTKGGPDEIKMNAVHGSDSRETAIEEIRWFFGSSSVPKRAPASHLS